MMEWSKSIMGQPHCNTYKFFADHSSWHADIKPDNILIVAENGPDGNEIEKFKLADPGFAKFVKKTGTSPIEVPLSGGTETYGNKTQNPCQ